MVTTNMCLQAYRSIFLGQSHADGVTTRTKGGNARIYGMVSVKPSTICYAVIQVIECIVSAVALVLTFGNRCM